MTESTNNKSFLERWSDKKSSVKKKTHQKNCQKVNKKSNFRE